MIPNAATTPPRHPAEIPGATTKAMSGRGATRIARISRRKSTNISGATINVQ